ncbi:MAG: hypothetical protein KJP15_10885 [Gammaproteobacteria bacterium]|nr:hypothetical protein [Gammaproteobacteria bacterium]
MAFEKWFKYKSVILIKSIQQAVRLSSRSPRIADSETIAYLSFKNILLIAVRNPNTVRWRCRYEKNKRAVVRKSTVISRPVTPKQPTPIPNPFQIQSLSAMEG